MPKKSKAIALITSMHNTNTIDAYSGKQETVEFYNINKSGIESLDIKWAKYTTNPHWPLPIFFEMLDIAGVNSGEIFNTTKVRER